ncbi:hypothetical protein NPIL_458641 [Nephila pilipes]|uniref:Uncharacterized protein n=1 Tax=Nephila pilipes TaxID=299642 RepID=A0A8X6UQ98_NEPPI|nr:hypothetical protein NPIL_458641 [Nephila pilipes]
MITLSAVRRFIRTACDILLGIDSCNTEYLSETIDFQCMGLISSNSKKEASFSESELLEKNVENYFESKREKLQSENNMFKHNSSQSCSLRYNSSGNSTKILNFKNLIMKYKRYEEKLSENENKP